MNTKIIFNTDKKLKELAQKKARAQGLTLSAMLNLATRAYVDEHMTIDMLARDITEARRGTSVPASDVYRRLRIKK